MTVAPLSAAKGRGMPRPSFGMHYLPIRATHASVAPTKETCSRRKTSPVQ
jgi:hypothetical protein